MNFYLEFLGSKLNLISYDGYNEIDFKLIINKIIDPKKLGLYNCVYLNNGI